MLDIKTVTVIGANGSMGSLTSGIIASLGNAKVYLVSRNRESSKNVIEKIKKSVRSDYIEKNLIARDFSDLEDCVRNSDWVFESVIENYEVKADIFKRINNCNDNNAIITTGTSGLSIEKLASNLNEENRKRFLCTHFFNPPYNLNLCELIYTRYTDINILKDMEEYLNKILLRKNIIVKDEPAFLANRIGFKFLNEMLVLADKYKDKGGIDYIDSLFTGFTGRAMKPIETINFVGLNVHKAIVDNVYNNTDDEFKESFLLPDFMNNLIENSKKAFLYNRVEKKVYDIKTGEYRQINKYINNEISDINSYIHCGRYVEAYKSLFESNSEEMKIVSEYLIKYICYSLIVASNISNNINDCDIAMANGFNWCPPIALKELIEKSTDLNKLIEKYIDKSVIDKYDLYNLLKSTKSEYDYRRYIRVI